jgi:hypothetical protein
MAINWRTTVPALVVCAAGCVGSDTPGPATVERDSAGIMIVENDAQRVVPSCAVGPEPVVTIGTAAGAPEYELFRVFGAVRLSDGRIALVNQGSQQLRIYDAEGRFLTAAGRAGEGPGEFRNAFYLWALPGDTIWVGDYRPWQYHVFSPEGTWIRTVRPEPTYGNSPGVMALLDDGRAVLADRGGVFGAGPQFAARELTVLVHGPDGALLDTLGTYPNGRWGRLEADPSALTMFPLFESFAHVTAAGSRIVTGLGAAPELTVIDATAGATRAPGQAGDEGLRVERIVRWTTSDRAVSSAHVSAERERIAEQYADTDPEMRRRLVAPLLSEDRPVADRFPAFNAVRLGRDGRVWVREFVPPGSDDGPRWLAFAAAGRLSCDARMPDVDQILEVGADYVLALDRDDDGVERVHMYALDAPGAS